MSFIAQLKNSVSVILKVSKWNRKNVAMLVLVQWFSTHPELLTKYRNLSPILSFGVSVSREFPFLTDLRCWWCWFENWKLCIYQETPRRWFLVYKAAKFTIYTHTYICIFMYVYLCMYYVYMTVGYNRLISTHLRVSLLFFFQCQLRQSCFLVFFFHLYLKKADDR